MPGGKYACNKCHVVKSEVRLARRVYSIVDIGLISVVHVDGSCLFPDEELLRS